MPAAVPGGHARSLSYNLSRASGCPWLHLLVKELARHAVPRRSCPIHAARDLAAPTVTGHCIHSSHAFTEGNLNFHDPAHRFHSSGHEIDG
jgi:hypothetical protein